MRIATLAIAAKKHHTEKNTTEYENMETIKPAATSMPNTISERFEESSGGRHVLAMYAAIAMFGYGWPLL